MQHSIAPDSYTNAPYQNNIFVSSSKVVTGADGTAQHVPLRKPFTLAHEIGHILTNKGHYVLPTEKGVNADYMVKPAVFSFLRDHNLMRFGTSDKWGFGESKRLHQVQEYYTKFDDQPTTSGQGPTPNPNAGKFK